MAEIEVDFQVREPKLDTTINKFKQLKKEMLDAKSALAGLEQGTEEYARQAAKVGQINDKIRDLNQSVKAVSGEPIENLTGSFGLLRSQVESLDFKGAASSLKSMTQAASGLSFKTLTEGVKGFGSSMIDLGKTLLSSPIFILAAAIGGIVYAINLWVENNKKIEESQAAVNELLKEAAERQKDYTERTREASIQLDVLNGKITEQQAELLRKQDAQGKERMKLAQKYAKDILELAKKLELDLTDAAVTNGKLRFDEYYKGDFLDMKRRIAFNKQVIQLEQAARKEGIDLVKTQLLETEVVIEKQHKEALKNIKRRKREEKQAIVDVDIEILEQKKNTTKLSSKQDAELINTTNYFGVDVLEKQKNERIKGKEDELKDLEKLESAYFNSISNLSDAYFNGELERAKGNEVLTDKIRRKQFYIDRAVKATQATIDTLRGVAAAAPNIPLQIAVGISGAAIVAKILSTQYQSASNTPINNTTPIANNQVPTAPPIGGPQTLIRNQNEPVSQRVYVLESDIKKSTNRVNVLQNRATF